MTSNQRPNCKLILSTGDTFEGQLIGAERFASGELVFTTGMVGYSEAISDPSYFGQILVFSYPLIGNYGIPKLEVQPFSLTRGFESHKPQAAGVIVALDSGESFHWNSSQTLHQWLAEHGVPAIAGLDTRHLVTLIRSNPGLKARIVPSNSTSKVRSYAPQFDEIMKNGFFDPSAQEILKWVSTPERFVIGKGNKRVAVLDCGVKWNILRQIVAWDCEVEILPWDTDLNKVDCSGWLLSNGPGDPSKTGDTVSRIKDILKDSKPVLGICLGHQLLGLAAGAKTKKLPFGHRSHNQPVYEVGTERGYITSQNHGYVIDPETLPKDWEVWFANVNDDTVEGIRHKSKPFRSIQFHPEAAGGPRDTTWVMEQFLQEILK